MKILVLAGLICCIGAFLSARFALRTSRETYPEYVVLNLIVAAWALAIAGVLCLVAAPQLGLRGRTAHRLVASPFVLTPPDAPRTDVENDA